MNSVFLAMDFLHWRVRPNVMAQLVVVRYSKTRRAVVEDFSINIERKIKKEGILGRVGFGKK